MAVLTWRNVDAPDFRTSMQGMQNFGAGLNNAFSGLKDGLKEYDSSIDDRVNKAFALELAKFQDPAALQAALAADPTLGQNANRVSVASIKGAGEQVDNLLERATSQSNLDWNGYTRDRTKTENTNIDAARGDVSKFITASLAGDEAGARKVLTESATLRNMTPDQLMEVASKGSDLSGEYLNRGETRQDISQGAARFNRETADYTAQRNSEVLVNKVLSATPRGDIEGALGNLETLGNGYSPQEISLARAALSGQMGSLYTAPASDFAAGGGASGNPWTTAVGGSSLPDTVKTVGDAINYGRQVLIPANRGNAALGLPPGKGSSAMGAYQITGETMEEFGKAALGDNWRNADFGNPIVQTKIAEKIFASTGRDPAKLRSRWAALSADEAVAVSKMPVQQALQFIAQQESGARSADFSINPATLAISAAAARSQTLTDGSPQGFGTNMNNPASANKIAAQMIKDGEFKGIPQEAVVQQIAKIVNMSRTDKGVPTLNAAQAADILAQNHNKAPKDWLIRSSDWLSSLGGTYTTPQYGDANSFDDRGIVAAVEAAKKGGQVGALTTAQNSARVEQTLLAAQENVRQKQQNFIALQRQAISRPGLKDALAKAEAEYRAAQMNLNMIGASVREDTSLVTPARKQEGKTKPSSVTSILNDMFTIRRSGN